ncbi:MAG TPA: RNA polymerase sigma-70 factor [Bacteroidales bacterium]|nr:RNA polymerase sigma-70 factor [Bacteroidales bacterium]
MPEIDRFLWSRVKSGDKEAFGILFEKYYALLCLISKRYTCNMVTSKEIIQALFVNLWDRKKELDISGSVKHYLYQCARYNSIRYLQKERKSIRFDFMSENAELDAEFHDHIEYAELQEKIVRTIDALPEQCQKVFKMSRFEQLKQSEIADRLGISIKTVETHISKALRLLEEKLQEDLI